MMASAMLVAMLAAGCGGPGERAEGPGANRSQAGEATASGTAASPSGPSRPWDEDEVRLARYVELARGHVEALRATAEAGQLQAAHAAHPVGEVLPAFEAQLQARDAAVARQTRQSLEVLARSAGAPGSEGQGLQEAVAAAEKALEQALAVLVTESALSDPAFRAAVTAGLLEAVAEEYSEAVAGGQVREIVEYQDAWGFLQRAKAVWAAAAGGEAARKETREVEEQLRRLDGLLTSVLPSAQPADVADVKAAVEEAVHELRELAGPAGGGGEGGREAVAAIRRLLEEARTAYAGGDRERALELVSSAYLDHYEGIEHEVMERAPRLNEAIEPVLGRQLREQVRAGVPADQVAAAIDRLLQAVAEVEELLEQGRPAEGEGGDGH